MSVAVFFTGRECALLDTVRNWDTVSPKVVYLGGTMSRKLGAIALVLGILICSMGLKTVLSGGHSSTTLIAGNGPDPVPPPPPPKKL